jgi:hypothetical protein
LHGLQRSVQQCRSAFARRGLRANRGLGSRVDPGLSGHAWTLPVRRVRPDAQLARRAGTNPRRAAGVTMAFSRKRLLAAQLTLQHHRCHSMPESNDPGKSVGGMFYLTI